MCCAMALDYTDRTLVYMTRSMDVQVFAAAAAGWLSGPLLVCTTYYCKHGLFTYTGSQCCALVCSLMC